MATYDDFGNVLDENGSYDYDDPANFGYLTYDWFDPDAYDLPALDTDGEGRRI